MTRAGYFETPAKATPSPMTSSSPCVGALEVSIVRMAAYASRASPTVWPVTRSVSTEVDATLIEQPRAS